MRPPYPLHHTLLQSWSQKTIDSKAFNKKSPDIRRSSPTFAGVTTLEDETNVESTGYKKAQEQPLDWNEAGSEQALRTKEPKKDSTLHYKDDGKGLTKDEIQKSEGLGWQLIESLTDQLGGKLTIKNKKGLDLMITFKELRYKKRY